MNALDHYDRLYGDLELTVLYTTPQQRKPLTDEQVTTQLRKTKLSIIPATSFCIGFRAAEDVHGIKE
jgi:hypothetical protein